MNGCSCVIVTFGKACLFGLFISCLLVLNQIVTIEKTCSYDQNRFVWCNMQLESHAKLYAGRW